MRLVSSCPVCHKKNVSESSHAILGSTRFITLDCGHTYLEKGVKVSEISGIELADKRKLYPFQVEGVKFLEKSNFKALIADEMGLGKTIQAIGAINLHFEELKPILIVVKSSLTHNWLREIVRGSNRLAQVYESGDKIIPGIEIVVVSFDSLIPRKSRNSEEINNSNIEEIKKLAPKTIILDEVQMIKNHNAKRTQAIRDIARATVKIKDTKEPIKNTRVEMIAKDLIKYHGLTDRFELKFTTLAPSSLGVCECRVDREGIIRGRILISKSHAEKDSESEVIETILHEISHAITPGAGHRKIWQETCLAIGGNGQAFANCEGSIDLKDTEPMVKNIIALSGTPIKNNAIEYFPILNLLHPEMFPSLQSFERNYVDYYCSSNTYKAGGLRDPEYFKSRTSEFIIRRTREEVLPDLPKIQRDYKYYPLSDAVKKAYAKKVKGLNDFLLDRGDNHGGDFFTELIGHLGILRHITGIAKTEPVIEYILEYLGNEESSKLTVFHHHISVGDILEKKLSEAEVGLIRMKSSDDSAERMAMIDCFRDDSSKRVFILPTLAGGEGINLQFCQDAVILEREWNPANEEQAEGRFSRIGANFSSVNVLYPIALGTIDEYFAEIVERKRQIVTEALSGEQSNTWDQSSIMLELAEMVINKWRP